MTDPHFDKYRILEGIHWQVYISERGGNNLGRLYFWLNRDGIVDYDQLTKEELDELGMLYAAYKQALLQLWKPKLINFAYLANEESHGHHCHYHFVPRYKNSRAFNGAIFNDITWGHLWTSEKMADELAIAVGKAITEAATPFLTA